jgi:hypothetical protein
MIALGSVLNVTFRAISPPVTALFSFVFKHFILATIDALPLHLISQQIKLQETELPTTPTEISSQQ